MHADPTFAIDTWAMIAVLMFGGGTMPVSLPPGQPDAVLDRLAPADPLVFLNVSGRAEPSAESKNRTEQLFAEPELQEAMRQGQQIFRSLALKSRGSNGDQVAARMAPAFFQMFLTRPWMLYATTIDMAGPRYDLRGAFVANLGPMEASLKRALSLVPAEVTEDVEIAGHTFRRIEVNPKAPVVTFGIFENRFYMTIGEEELETVLARAERAVPQWLTKLRQRFDVPRIASLVHVTPAKLIAKRTARDPLLEKVIRAMGLGNLTSLSVVTGLDQDGTVQFTALDTEGPLQGVLAASPNEPLTAEDLQPIPQDSLIAMATRMDAAKVFDVVMDTLTPAAQRDFKASEPRVCAKIGTSLEELLGAFGDVWTLHTAAADGGFISGWTATVTLRDRDRIVQWLATMERILKETPDARLQKGVFLDQPYTMFSIADAQMPFAPTFAIIDDRLVVALYPQAVKSYLSRQRRNEATLADFPNVAAALKQQPVTISTIDNKQVLQLVYPLLQMGARMGLAELRREGVYVDDSLMPSTTSIVRHFGVGVTHSRYTDSGVVIEQRQTLPTGCFSAMTPMAAALLLPAIEQARSQARVTVSINNMRQIGIAMHNFHDTFNGFPARYRTDKDGKPLLSWRVHLLPFIESSPLYEQFHLDEPWDSPHNKQLIAKMPTFYRSRSSKAEPGKTTYLAIDGKDSTIMPPAPTQFGEKYQKGTRMRDISDGTSYSALVVEVNDDHAVIWTKPDDYKPPANDPAKGLRGLPGNHIHVGLADGSVQRISPQAATKKFLEAIFTKSGGETIELRQ